ncbi:MAG: hypothetical protein RSC68_15175 [Acinetobacter sp.]
MAEERKTLTLKRPAPKAEIPRLMNLREIIRFQMSHSDIQALQQAGRQFVSSMTSIRKTR